MFQGVVLQMKDSIDPVSYTHLDVYKRQVVGSLEQNSLGGVHAPRLAVGRPSFPLGPVSYTHLGADAGTGGRAVAMCPFEWRGA